MATWQLGNTDSLFWEQARMLLRPDKAIITEPHHVWPTLTDEQWIKARPPHSLSVKLPCLAVP